MSIGLSTFLTTAQLTAHLLTASPAEDVSPLEAIEALQPPTHEYAPYIEEEVGKRAYELKDVKHELDETKTDSKRKDERIKELEKELDNERRTKKIAKANKEDKANDNHVNDASPGDDNTVAINDGSSNRDSKRKKDEKAVKSKSKPQGESFVATAYTAYCSTGCTGVTATGVDVSSTTHHQGRNVVAVDPSVIPFGSKVRIQAGGRTIEGIASDSGGDIKGRRIDVLMASDSEAIDFGRQNVSVEVIE